MKITTRDFRNYVQYERYTQMIVYTCFPILSFAAIGFEGFLLYIGMAAILVM